MISIAFVLLQLALGQPRQPSCQLQLDTAFVFQPEGEPGRLTGSAYVAHSGENIAVAPAFTHPQIFVVDASGNLVSHWSPEQEGWPTGAPSVIKLAGGVGRDLLALWEDRLVAFGPDMDVEWTRPVRGRPFDLTAVGEGEILINFPSSTAEGLRVLHVLRAARDGLDSLAHVAEPTAGLPPQSWGAVRVTAEAAGSGFWAAEPGRRTLIRYSPDGQAVDTVRVGGDWFQEWEDAPLPGARPAHQILDLQDLAEGRLLILTRLPEAGETPPRITDPAGDLTVGYDSMAEVVDSETGVVQCSLRLDQVWSGVRGRPGALWALSLDSAGAFTLTVARLRVIP